MTMIGGIPLTRSVSQEFEDLATSYRSECAQGIPMSVHERYERRLTVLRKELRSRGAPCRLGDVLRGMGALDEKRLASALSIQSARGGERLLGEILIDLGWVDEQAVRRAVAVQAESQSLPS